MLIANTQLVEISGFLKGNFTNNIASLTGTLTVNGAITLGSFDIDVSLLFNLNFSFIAFIWLL